MSEIRKIVMEYTPPFRVDLQYFDPQSGKYRYSGGYHSQKLYLFEIFQEVREMLAAGTRPGLVDGENKYFVLVDVPHHPHAHPCLIIPEVINGING